MVENHHCYSFFVKLISLFLQINVDAIDLGLDLPEIPRIKNKIEDLNVMLSEDPDEYYNIHGLVGDDSCKHYTEQERIIMLL